MVTTEDIKLVSDYTGINFNEALELDCFTFRMLFKDAFIYKMRSREEGKEYLENCWLLTQTQPDKENLRQLSKGGI